MEDALAPPHVLPGGFAILPSDDAPRTLYARDTAGGAVRQIALGGHPIAAIAVTGSGVFAATRGGVSEKFDGRVLHLPHGAAEWQVLATGRKLPDHLIAFDRGVAWSYERERGYVVEGCVDGRLVTIAERTLARLVALAPGAGELVLSENRVKRLLSGATLVTSEFTLLAVR